MNKTALDQYEEIVTDALKSCSAKLRKSFKTAFIQLMILYMVLPRKINFTQMGRYSDSSEQRFRQLFEREFDRMQFNLFLMRQHFGESTRKAIAIDASYISKSGKKTPYIGKFWSGCASAMKRGLEILGIGIVDIDSRDCMMLCAEQTPDKAYLEKQGEEYNLVDWYLDVLRKYRDKLLDITLQMPGSQRQSSWVKPVCRDSMSSAVCVMMPPCGIHMTVSAQANGDDHASKAKRLILRNSTFSVARSSTSKEEEPTLSRPIQRQ